MYRKQEKGWARTGGVVKEDSKFFKIYHSTLLLTQKGVIHSIHYHRLVLDEAHSIKVNSFRRLPLLFSTNPLTSNVRLVLPRPVLPCRLLTNGVCLAPRYRIESASFSPCFVFFRSAHFHAISASNAAASSFSGLQTNRAVVRNATTRM